MVEWYKNVQKDKRLTNKAGMANTALLRCILYEVILKYTVHAQNMTFIPSVSLFKSSFFHSKTVHYSPMDMSFCIRKLC